MFRTIGRVGWGEEQQEEREEIGGQKFHLRQWTVKDCST